MSLGRKKETGVVLGEHNLGSREPAQETEEQWAERPLPGPLAHPTCSPMVGVCLCSQPSHPSSITWGQWALPTPVREHNHDVTCAGKALPRNALQKPGAMTLIQEWMGTPVLTDRWCNQETAV